MSSTAYLFASLTGFYMVLAYLFLSPDLFIFLSGPHPEQQKFLHLVAFMAAPLILPVAGLLVLGWWALVACFGLAAMIVIYPLYWLHSRLASGKLFRAWFRLAARLVGWLRKKIEIFLGVSFSSQNHPENSLTHPINSPIQ
jgi:hypothetical protein